MSEHNKMLVDLFRRTGMFRHLYEINESIFVAGDVCDLTGFCAPSLRKRSGVYRIDYELGLVTTVDDFDSEHGLKKGLIDRRYVILPKSIPPSNSFDMIVRDGKLSDWLIKNMLQMMNMYCLPRDRAISLIEGGSDRFLGSLREVYGVRFDRYILGPLRRERAG